jgi:hypothetical protein
VVLEIEPRAVGMLGKHLLAVRAVKEEVVK